MPDWYKTRIFFIPTLFLLLFTTLILAEPPFIQDSGNTPFTEGLIIDYPKFIYYPAFRNLELHFHVYNISTGRVMDNDTISCKLFLYNDTGENFYTVDRVEVENDLTSFVMSVNNTSILKTGGYGWTIYCNTSYLGGYSSGNAELTKTGEGDVVQDTEEEYFLYFVFALAIILLGISFYKNDHNLATISGMVLVILGGYIIAYGFSSLNNTLSSGLGIILIGVGIYILLRSNIDYITGE